MYCEKCHTLFEGVRCPVCRSKKIREVRADDLCLLTERDHIWSGMLEDVLHQHQIPFITRSLMGAGLTMIVGSLSEIVRFYVPYSHLPQAQELVDELFASDQSDDE